MQPLHVAGARKCAAYIASPHIVFQAHLRWGVADALAAGEVKRKLEALRQRAGDFGGVVETTLADALRMERHGNETVGTWMGGDALGQTTCQHRHDGELAVVFEARDEPVDRERILQRGVGVVKGGRMFEATAANRVGWGWGGALRTLWLAVPWQLGMARVTQGVRTRGGATEQAALHNDAIKN